MVDACRSNRDRRHGVCRWAGLELAQQAAARLGLAQKAQFPAWAALAFRVNSLCWLEFGFVSESVLSCANVGFHER